MKKVLKRLKDGRIGVVDEDTGKVLSVVIAMEDKITTKDNPSDKE